MNLPHDPHLPPLPPVPVVVPPLIREELAKAMKTAGGTGAPASVDALWGGVPESGARWGQAMTPSLPFPPAGIPVPESEARWGQAMAALKGVWASKYNDRAYYSLR